jgi:hypothetical protein
MPDINAARCVHPAHNGQPIIGVKVRVREAADQHKFLVGAYPGLPIIINAVLQSLADSVA